MVEPSKWPRVAQPGKRRFRCAPRAAGVLALISVCVAIGAAFCAEPSGPKPLLSTPSPVYPKGPEEMEALARTDPLRLLQVARDWHGERIVGYTCRFQKVENIDGELRKPETMRMKFRKTPFSVYLKWISDPSKDQEVIYVEGANKGKAVVHPPGILGILFRRVSIDPFGKTATKHSRRPITMAGMENMISLITGQSEEAKAKGDLTLTYEGIRHDGGRPSYVLKRVLPEKKGYPCEVLIIYIDTEYLVCVRTDAYDWGGELQSHYFYTDLALNPGVTNEDFDPDNRAYAYRLF
ncbi:MAG TPA: DUF1571 domain-containing protein [Phycisphaerae bacterium]|nr:DUF1571 domain-containing protein [Phycisphaerae bacterium]